MFPNLFIIVQDFWIQLPNMFRQNFWSFKTFHKVLVQDMKLAVPFLNKIFFPFIGTSILNTMFPLFGSLSLWRKDRR